MVAQYAMNILAAFNTLSYILRTFCFAVFYHGAIAPWFYTSSVEAGISKFVIRYLVKKILKLAHAFSILMLYH